MRNTDYNNTDFLEYQPIGSRMFTSRAHRRGNLEQKISYYSYAPFHVIKYYYNIYEKENLPVLTTDAFIISDFAKAPGYNSYGTRDYGIGRYTLIPYNKTIQTEYTSEEDGIYSLKKYDYFYTDYTDSLDWNLVKSVTVTDGDYTQSEYFPDGTLRRRTFSSRKVETVVTVNAAGDTITKTRTRTQTAVHTYSGAFEKTPDGLIYHTGAGHYDLAAKKHVWYLRDRMGSTVAVVGADGALLQTTGYYPSGTPYRLPSATIQTPVDAKTDRLHIGNRWLGHSGLAMYDNTARMHDPLLMRYAAPDPLYAKFGSLSPWSHCAANPLNIIDPLGLDTIQLNENGTFTPVARTDDKFDIILGRDGASIQVDKGSINPLFKGMRSATASDGVICELPVAIYKAGNSSRQTFEFLAKNSSVEWSIFESSVATIIGSSHSKDKDLTLGTVHDKFLSIYNSVTRFDHSHLEESCASDSDRSAAAMMLRQVNSNIIFSIFHVPTSKYYYFEPNLSTLREAVVKGPKAKKLLVPVKQIDVPNLILR